MDLLPVGLWIETGTHRAKNSILAHDIMKRCMTGLMLLVLLSSARARGRGSVVGGLLIQAAFESCRQWWNDCMHAVRHQIQPWLQSCYTVARISVLGSDSRQPAQVAHSHRAP